MDTLKTAIVVVLLLAVLYGVYVTLNQPDQEIPEDIAWAQQQTTAPLQVEFGSDAGGGASGVTASLSDSEPWSSDPQGGHMDAHEHSPANMQATATTDIPAGNYGPPAPTTPVNQVAAPQLISPTAGDSSAGQATAGPGQMEEPGGYAMPAQPATGQTADPAAAAGGYAASSYNVANAAPADGSSGTTGYGPPAANTNSSSIYAPPAATDALSGSYGEPAGLSGNAQVVATAEPPVADSFADPAAAPGTAPGSNFSRIESVIQTAQGQIDQGQHYEALLTLSFAYNSPGISVEENEKLQRWLDPLAGKVIYSNEHLIGGPYQIQAGETLQSVAAKHNVPWQLLANINGLRDPAAVQPGTSIKVVPGPFHAEVDIANRSLTLFAGRLYAGKFAVKIGNNTPTPGEYQVNDKQPGHSYYAGNAQTLSPEDPQNPYGAVWIDLGGNVSIHGTSSSAAGSEQQGCISLASKDANDLYGILSVGSNVVIR